MKFPLLLTNGENTVRIYKVTSRGKTLYQIAWREAGVRLRRSFTRYQQARQEGVLILTNLSARATDMQKVNVADMESYLAAKEHLETVGIPLHDAAESYARAKEELGKASLFEAVRFYKAYHAQEVEDKIVRELLRDFLESRIQRGVSNDWQRQLRHITKLFGKAFGNRRLYEIRTPELEKWLANSKWSARTQNNNRKVLVAFGAWCQSQGYLPKDRPTEFSQIQLVQEKPASIGIFTPAEIEKWLRAADPCLVPFLAIGAFAGLRTAEIERLDWKHIKLDRGFIEAAAELTKTRARRIVPISENLKAWLAPHQQSEGKIVPYRSLQNAITQLGKRSGLKWVKNGLRHSYISYRLAIMPDTARVALECGNSPDIIFKHYRELVTEEDAKAWFGIMPE